MIMNNIKFKYQISNRINIMNNLNQKKNNKLKNEINSLKNEITKKNQRN